jgi:hypothetical protein
MEYVFFFLPCSSQPSYTCLYNFVVLLFSSLLAAILVALIPLKGPGGPGMYFAGMVYTVGFSR